jgi:coenzyme F420-reducing hydrogenase delta subunit
MCSARLDTDFIYEAYRLGAGAVLFSGCHPQDCHYITGQPIGERRAERLQRAFERMGMTPGRFRIEWISAAEGDKYARVINEMQDVLDGIPKEELLAEIDGMRDDMARRARRMREAPLVDEALTYAGEIEAVRTATAVPVAEEA